MIKLSDLLKIIKSNEKVMICAGSKLLYNGLAGKVDKYIFNNAYIKDVQYFKSIEIYIKDIQYISYLEGYTFNGYIINVIIERNAK